MSSQHFSEIEQYTLDTLLEKDDLLSYLSQPNSFPIYSKYFDTQKIKQLIDLALTPQIPSNSTQISIESFNVKDEPLDDNKQRVYKTKYLYPYISSEILSHEFPFINEKIIPKDNLVNMTFQDNLLCEQSITNYSGVGDNEGGIIADDIMEDGGVNFIPKNTFQFNPPEIEYNTDKEISFNASLDKKLGFGGNMNEMSMMSGNYELIDYIFNLCANVELNSVQGGYLVKIIQSFIHYSNNTYSTKGNVFLNYLCFKKEIFYQLLNNFSYVYYQKIILEILIFDSGSSEDDNNVNDIYKKQILNFFSETLKKYANGNISTNFLSFGSSNNLSGLSSMNTSNNSINSPESIIINIFELLIEYLETAKNSCELLMSDVFINNIIVFANTAKLTPDLFDVLCNFYSALIKEYKIEDKNLKFLNISSFSKSHMKNLTLSTTERNEVLHLDSNCEFVKKLNGCFEFGKNFYLFPEESPNSKSKNPFITNTRISPKIKVKKSNIISFMELFCNFLNITQNLVFFNNLIQIKFFETSTKYFFSFGNDIFQSLYVSSIKQLINDKNTTYINEMLIKSNFFHRIFGMNDSLKKGTQLFVHIADIYDTIINKPEIKSFLCIFLGEKTFTDLYQRNFHDELEKMHKPLAGFQGNDLYLSRIFSVGPQKLEIDEVEANEKKTNSSAKKSKDNLNFELGDIDQENKIFDDDD
ncbi:MAG: hypothetical protein MJ252_02945 [archaeon]|nr:hypothetical protein [archaeon]